MKLLKDYLAGVEEEDPTFIDDSHMYYKGVDFILAFFRILFCSQLSINTFYVLVYSYFRFSILI